MGKGGKRGSSLLNKRTSLIIIVDLFYYILIPRQARSIRVTKLVRQAFFDDLRSTDKAVHPASQLNHEGRRVSEALVLSIRFGRAGGRQHYIQQSVFRVRDLVLYGQKVNLHCSTCASTLLDTLPARLVLSGCAPLNGVDVDR